MIENAFKAPLNLSPLKCTYLGEKIISITLALSQKIEIEKWPHRTLFQCINCSYNNVAKGIRFLDKKQFLFKQENLMQVRAYERYVPLS